MKETQSNGVHEKMRLARRVVTCIMLAFVLLVTDMIQVPAAEKVVTIPCEAVKRGRYIYYAYEMGGVRMGIMRYDTKSRTKKEISSYMAKGDGTNGFYDLNLSGNYLYVVWDRALGTDHSENYIYRISIKDGKKKKLAVGISPIVIGDYVYYI